MGFFGDLFGGLKKGVSAILSPLKEIRDDGRDLIKSSVQGAGDALKGLGNMMQYLPYIVIGVGGIMIINLVRGK